MGLGIMGTGMAGRVLATGFPLAVYNRHREKAEPFGRRGAFVASTPREAAARADVIISMLADDEASREVWLGENGALAGAAPGTVLVASSTLSVGWVCELAASARSLGCELLDAPVTGTKPHAARGELLFLVGGSAEALAIARPVLTVMSRDIVHVGATGSGALLKLVNNFLCGVQAASLAEATALIDAGGINRDKALSVLTNGAPGSPLIKTLAARVTTGDLAPNFLLRLMAKDIRYARAEAARRGLSLGTGASAERVFENAIAAGLGDKDFAAVVGSVRPA